MKELINFLKIPWKDIDYDWKWFRVSFYFFPLVCICPFMGTIVSKFMTTFIGGQCSFMRMFGYYCPGCGGTRAILLIEDGQLLQSLLLNPLPMYALIIYSCFFIKNLLYILTRGKIKKLAFNDWWVYIALIIIIVNCVIKNIFLYNGIDINILLSNMYLK